MPKSLPEFSFWVTVPESLPESGKTYRIEAKEKDLEILKEIYDCLRVISFSAELTLLPWKKSGVHVTGSVSGTLVHSCVVTGVPIRQDICEDCGLYFLPESKKDTQGKSQKRHKTPDLIEISDQNHTPLPPEPFDGKSLDLGLIACNQLSLGINPFPRQKDLPPLIYKEADITDFEEETCAEKKFAKLKDMIEKGE